MPSPVQVTSGSSITTSLTLTFGSNITAGHSVIVCACGPDTNSANGFTVSGGSDTYTQGVADNTDGGSSIWYVLSSAGGYKSISLSAPNGGGGLIGYAYEVSGPTATDKSSTNASASGPTWTSNATGAQTGSIDFAVGIGQVVYAATAAITGPSSPWVNESAINNVAASGETIAGISGYQFLTSNSSVTYSGSSSGTTFGAGSACVMTFKMLAINLPVAQVNIAAYPPSFQVGLALPLVRVNIQAFLPALKQLIFAVAGLAGTDQFGNNYGKGVNFPELTSVPATPPAGTCLVYYYQGALYALGPSGSPVKLATT